MHRLSDFLLTVAPTIRSALLGPLSGSAIASLGKLFGIDNASLEQVSEAVTGGKLTPEQLGEIRKMEQDYQSHERERGFSYAELEFNDCRRAGKSDVSDVAHSRLFLLSLALLGICLGLEAMALFKGYPNQIPEIFIGRLLGLADAMAIIVLYYMYGTSAGRQSKPERVFPATQLRDKCVEMVQIISDVAKSSVRRWPLSSDQSDWLITAFFTGFWLWFAWQHGYNNSPDSWYRGLLANSIIEGHPYVVNLRQGWLYDYPAWHPDAAHPPFLPAIYAFFFLLFGPQISISNIVVSLSAGLLVFPSLRLSRMLTGAPLAGVVVYLAVAFNDSAEFIFEVFGGLSIPVALALLAAAFYFMLRLANTGAFRDLLGGVLALVGFYYVRPGEQLIFGWLMLWAGIIGFRLLPRQQWISQMQMWGGAAVLVLPWAVRNLVLLGSPIFTHTTPALWTDRGYDYWDYHETIPLPSAAVYFSTHTLQDFLGKIVTGVVKYSGLLNDTLSGQLLLLGLGAIYALIVVLRKVKDPRTRFIFWLFFLCLAGYSIIYSLVPVLDKRYMMLPHFLLLAMVAGVAFMPAKDVSLPLRLPVIGLLAYYVLSTQAVFWTQHFPKYLTFTYANSDQSLARDSTIRALKQRVGASEAVLGPFASVQRLSFATGLTFIEQPDNLYRLKDPVAFFERYQIRFAMLDVSRILPDSMIESIELVGNSPLFAIRLGGASPKQGSPLAPEKLATQSQSVNQSVVSVSSGIKTRRVYVDGFHGAPPSELKVLMARVGNVDLGKTDLVTNSELLMNAGLYVLRYGNGKPGMSQEELMLIERFVAAGGRVLLLCPAWVPLAYEKQNLSELSFNRIAQGFGIFFSAEMASAPLSVAAGINREGKKSLPIEGASFSRVIGRRSALAIATDAAGHNIAIGQVRGKSRAVLWGHDNLFEPSVTNTVEGREVQGQILNWLFDEG